METELGAEAFWIVLLAGILSGAFSVWIFRRFSDQDKLRLAVNRVLAHLLELRLFGDEPRVVLQAQWNLLRANAEMLRQAVGASLVLLAPLALLFITGEALFSLAPIRIGESALVTAQWKNSEADAAPVTLQLPPGMTVETPPVHVPREHSAWWRVRASRSSCGTLQVISRSGAVSKTICSEPGLHWLSHRRTQIMAFFTYPLEYPFSHGDLRSISVLYSPAVIFGLPWLVWFLLGSLLGSALAFARKLAFRQFRWLPLAGLLFATGLRADTASALLARGYTALPEPQRVSLKPGDFRFGSDWRLELGAGVARDSIAVQSLSDELAERHQIKLAEGNSSSHTVLLTVTENAVTPGAAQDRSREEIARQSYKIELQPSQIRITANADPGLFYGVQTLIQLLKRSNGAQWLPEGEIVDWPDLQLRQIYWDDAHHLEKLSDLKAAVREASFFKINGFIVKLEGHFQYRSAPALVEPQALSPAEFQELTDYGLRYHVQVMPYLDAPAHIAFILKHPEYASLRAFPDSNYESCITNPDAVKLMYGMFDDLLAANKGVHYFYLSTDEAYYVGMADNSQCGEKAAASKLGGRGKLLAQFTSQAATYLHDRGREVIFWGEYPLKAADIQGLPSFLINGETYGPDFDPVYRAHGMRQMIYQPIEGEERLFPHYFLAPPSRLLHSLHEGYQRVPTAVAQVASDSARQNSDLMGLVVAGWGDMGLHPETFWLGYASVSAAGWRLPATSPDQTMSAFYPLFYGPAIQGMNRLYQLMSTQAQTWSDSWDTVNSTARTPIWGNSEGVFEPPKPAHDQAIPLPPVPTARLQIATSWSANNAQRLTLAANAVAENDELLGLLNHNLTLAQQHHYNLEVFVSIAQLCRQNLDMLASLNQLDTALSEAASEARAGKAAEALKALDGALALARSIRKERNRVLHDSVATWYESWLPRVPESHGRRFLHEMDNVKDHLPDRTVDMSYLVYRELMLPLDDWYAKTQAARNEFANASRLPADSTPLNWKDLEN